MNAQDVDSFIRRWSDSQLGEQQAKQSHFIELCNLLDQRTPAQRDVAGAEFAFEKPVMKADKRQGFADVWLRDCFIWEYKGKYRNLDDAYAQALMYRGNLDNPPLIVVSDFVTYRIHPQWDGADPTPWVFTNDQLADPKNQRYLAWLFDPQKFKDERNAALRERSQITEKLAANFASLAEQMRAVVLPDGTLWSDHRIAQFLTRLVFVLFAEDIGLLPEHDGKPIFSYIVDRSANEPDKFAPRVKDLFLAMNGERREFMGEDIPYFNGGLFDNAEVLDVMQARVRGALDKLREVCTADWKKVNPTIVGTLFERALDKTKRSQLGAHYTSEADIRLIVEPVLMAPLRREWDNLRQQADPLMTEYVTPEILAKRKDALYRLLEPLYRTITERLAAVRVLDPACGSGNFLYVALRALKDLEAQVRAFFKPLNMHYRDVVTPKQFYGIEKDDFAAQLARVVVWIGYLQWRYEHADKLKAVSGRGATREDEIGTPILEPTAPGEPDRILNDDAILRYDGDGKPYEPEWPKADVIIGNPPFLGSSMLRAELGNKYVIDLFDLYRGRVPGAADLVTYWFEKARANIEKKQLKRAGLIATNSIRGGASRTVLDRIKKSGDIFMAWSDHEWELEGAAVRVSLIGFDNGKEQVRTLDRVTQTIINADLTASFDLTTAQRLSENAALTFSGTKKGGKFDITYKQAQNFLAESNSSGVSNKDVVKHWINGDAIVQGSKNIWIIDFGSEMNEEDSARYEGPYQYVKRVVYPVRASNNRATRRNRWWLHSEVAIGMRRAVSKFSRVIATPRVSKHRIFVWITSDILVDDGVFVVARDDDYFFGVLHSTLHEKWALRMGTSLEDRPRYTPTTTFETYPFPFTPGAEPTDDPRVQRIGAAAQQLNTVREAWLNPPIGDTGVIENLKKRTLTNLYNEVEKVRAARAAGTPYIRASDVPAAVIAEQVADLHEALDAAVLAAYGWDDLAGKLRSAAGEEEMLRRLLGLNLGRAG